MLLLSKSLNQCKYDQIVLVLEELLHVRHTLVMVHFHSFFLLLTLHTLTLFLLSSLHLITIVMISHFGFSFYWELLVFLFEEEPDVDENVTDLE